VVGENDFELSIPPFLGLHQYLMWNCFDHIFHLSWTLRMWPSSWPLQNSILTASKHVTFDWIMDTKTKDTHQQTIQLYRVVKAGQVSSSGQVAHQESDSTEVSPSDGGT
jgi:hypothetical protein